MSGRGLVDPVRTNGGRAEDSAPADLGGPTITFRSANGHAITLTGFDLLMIATLLALAGNTVVAVSEVM